MECYELDAAQFATSWTNAAKCVELASPTATCNVISQNSKAGDSFCVFGSRRASDAISWQTELASTVLKKKASLSVGAHK